MYSTFVVLRLRGGTGFVTWPQPIGAPQAFAEPSASITRWSIMTVSNPLSPPAASGVGIPNGCRG